MNVQIRDVDAVQTLRPMEVAAYLRSKGWVQQESNQKASYWIINQNDDEFEVEIVKNQSIRDYALRMGEVLHTLSTVEKRSETQIYADLLTTFADVVRIRLDDPDLKDGTLPIESYAQIAQKTRDLLMAAACSAKERRPVWHARKPTEAVEQVRKIRIGQSERGSYVVTVISRVPPAFELARDETLLEANPPFERQVIEMLASSLGSLAQAADDSALTGRFDSFHNAIAEGVSANLCDAVAGLWGYTDNEKNLDFHFTWSPSRPVRPAIPSKVVFAPDRIPWICEASRVIREQTPINDFELAGAVVRLDRPEGQTKGKITVFAQVDGKPKRVTLELEETDYQLAIEAHKKEQALRCLGSLVRDGRGYVLETPREVVVADE